MMRVSLRAAVAGLLLAAAPASAQPARIVGPAYQADKISVLNFGAKGDGTTDDTAAIEAARAAANGRADLYLPPGYVFRTSGTVLKSGDHITIDGTLKQLDNRDHSTLSAVSQSNIVIDGHGTIDGDSAGNSSRALPMACINLQTVSTAHVSGVHVTNCANWPINAWLNSSGIYLSNMELDHSGNSVECSNVTICYADHLNIHDINDYGWSFYAGVTDGKITDSSVSNSSAGFNALDDSAQPLPDNKLIFALNRATNNKGPGFSTMNSNGAYPKHTNVQFIGNTSDHNNQGNTANYGGYYIDGCDNCQVNDNTSDHNGNGAATTSGFLIGSNTEDVQVNDNISTDEGQGSTLGIGFSVNGGANRVSFIGNKAVDDQTTKTMAFGYNGTIAPNTRSIAIGNFSFGTIGPAFNWTTAYDTVSCNPAPNNSAQICSGLLLSPLTVSALTTCNSATKGALYVVSDATSPTYLGTLTGGGSTVAGALCNGSAWVAH